jgi:glycine/D-amino acid oxidase-like deaminating enzyme
MPKSFDVIIVGGGIMGCCAAYELTRRGRRVAVLEKDTIGAGSTGKSSAIIRQHYSNDLTARMALYSVRAFEQMPEQLGESVGFTKTGLIALVAAKDHAGLEANVELQRRVGIRTELRVPEALTDLMPGLETSDLIAAAWEPDAGYADPHLTVNAYANAARRDGAGIFLNTEVTGVRFAPGRVAGVDTTQGRFDAPQVLNCAGPWGARVARLAGVEAPIDSCRSQVAFFRRPGQGETAHPVVVDFVHATYFRAETGNLTLAGCIDPEEANAVVDPDRYNELQDDDFVIEVGERLMRRYRPLVESRFTTGYAGLYAITPDWHPIVDEVPAGSGFFVCAGFSGHGFKLGPAVGVMVADLLTGADEPQFPTHLFRLGRFAEGDPVKGQYEYSIAG